MGSHVNIPSEILLEGSAAVDNLVEDGGQSTREQTEIKELLELAKRLANNECNSGRLSELPPKTAQVLGKEREQELGET